MQIAWFCHALDTARGHQVFDELCSAGKEAGLPEPKVTWSSMGTWEDATLNWARAWSCEHLEARVLYTHTKGAFRDEFLVDKITGKAAPHSLNELWRGGMTDRLIRTWPSRVAELENSDLSGMHWVAPPTVVSSYFAGNFWWARADYLATLPALPELEAENRHDAEKWVAKGSPRVRALSEGFDSIPFPQTKHPATRIMAPTAAEAERIYAQFRPKLPAGNALTSGLSIFGVYDIYS